MAHLRRAPARALLLTLVLNSPAVADTVLIDSERTGPVSVISGDLIEVLPGGSVLNGIEGIVGAGDNEVIIRREGKVEGSTRGLQLGRDTSVLNQGQVIGGTFGIQIDGHAVVDNQNKIQGGTFGIFALEDVMVINSGDITGGTFGISSGGQLNLLNKKSIHGGTFGISANKDAFIRNFGDITGGVFGVDIVGDGRVVNHGRIFGGTFGLDVFGRADVWNYGLIEGGVFGINVFRDARIFNWGRINGDTFAVNVNGSAEIRNFNTIESGVFGINVSRDLDLWNYGKISGGTFGVNANGNADVRNWGRIEGGTFGLNLNSDGRVWNWGEIRGGTFGIVAQGDSFYLRNAGNISGGLFGVEAQGRTSLVENFGAISSPEVGLLLDSTFSDVRNHGSVTGGRTGIFFGGDASLVNHGVVRGGDSAVQLGGPRNLTLGGTGHYIGDVVGNGGRLRLDLVGVPVEVKQSLLRQGGPLDGPLHIPVFNIHARDFEFLEIGNLISFQEEAGGDFGSVGRALDWRDISRDGDKSAFVEGFGELVGQPQKLRDALENVSGRSLSHTASDMAFAGSYFWNQDLGHYFDSKRNKNDADAKSGLETTGWDGFAKTLGIFADQDRTSDRQDGDWTSHGAFVGGDYTCDDDVTIGGFGGYTRSEADVDDFGTTLSSDDAHGGVYGGWRLGKLSLDGALWYSNRDYDSKRVLDLPTFSQRAQAKFEADQLTSYLRASYSWRPSFDDRWEISPRVSLSQSHLWLDGWKEDSTPSRLGLETEDQEADSLRSSLGARVSGRLDLGKLTLQPELRVDWMHEYLDDGRGIGGRWASPAFQPFETESEVGDRDSAILGAGMTLNVPVCDCMKKLEFYAGYDVQLGREEFKAEVANFRVSYQF